MRFEAIALSEVGGSRHNNEDNLFFNHRWRRPEENRVPYSDRMLGENRRTLFAVCDGMGGEALGEQASYIAVSGLKVLEDRFNNVSGQSFPKLMDHYLSRTNETICQYIKQNKGLRMGTTMTSLLLGRNIAQAVSIGDSMAYLFRDGRLHVLSQKHTHVQRLAEMGIITEEEALYHPDRHRLTQHLGLFPEEKTLEPSVSPEIWIKTGDLFLICSDGISDLLSPLQLEDKLREAGDLQDAGSGLRDVAMEAGGKDNITLILIRILESNPIDHSLHPEAREEPPFELAVLEHAGRSKPTALRDLTEPTASQHHYENGTFAAEEANMKKQQDSRSYNTIPRQAAGMGAAGSGIPYQGKPPVRVPDSRQDVVRAPGQLPASDPLNDSTVLPVSQSAPLSQPVSNNGGGQYSMSDADYERFRQAQQAAAERQKAKRMQAAPVRVSTALDEERAYQERQQQKAQSRRGRRTGWQRFLGNALFLIAFIALGYAAGWLLVNFSVIRDWFYSLMN